MHSTFSRAGTSFGVLAAALLVGTVPVFPQAPTPAAAPSAAPAAQGPQAPGQPAGRGTAPAAGAPAAAAGAAPQAQAAPAAPPAFTPPPPASPRRYKVEVSMDGTSWGSPVAEGEGKGQATVITFAPVRAKYVRITQTGTAEPPTPWSIQRLRLYEVPDGK